MIIQVRAGRFKGEIGHFVTKRRSGCGFWPRSQRAKKGCPRRQDAAECWLKCGALDVLDVCDASKSFTNIELHSWKTGKNIWLYLQTFG